MSNFMESHPIKVGYIMSRFPKLTETFILNEILAMRKQGVEIEIYPLLRENQKVVHAETLQLVEHAHFHPFISIPIIKAHLHYLSNSPVKYFRVLTEVLKGTFGSLNFFVGALGIFPKSVRFAYEMAQSNVQHVHAHFATHPTVAALIVHRLTGIPFSFTAHGSDLHKERRMLARKVAASRFAVTISDYNRDMMVKESGEVSRAKIKVVHCGVEPEFFQFEPVKQNDIFQILCVASFEEVKGHKYLIQACERLARLGYEFECHFVGEGPLRSTIEKQIDRSECAARVHVHGGKPRNEVLAFLKQADVKVLASVMTANGKREGIPVVLMEAMACGVPVISSRISGIPELVEHGVSGFLVAPRNVEAISKALERLIQDTQLRHSLSKKARAKIEAEFNLHKNARELRCLFCDAVYPDNMSALDSAAKMQVINSM